MTKPEPIKIETTVNADLRKVWRFWTSPKHIKNWNSASEDWHTTRVENDFKKGGKFTFRMEAKDESQGFDFGGTYTKIEPQEHIDYILEDHRKVHVDFLHEGDKVKIIEIFDPESQNSIEMQRQGWQAILDNFKKYTEMGN